MTTVGIHSFSLLGEKDTLLWLVTMSNPSREAEAKGEQARDNGHCKQKREAKNPKGFDANA